MWTDDLKGADAQAWLELAAQVLGVEIGEQAPPGDAPKRRVVKKAPPKAAGQPGGLLGSVPIRPEPGVG